MSGMYANEDERRAHEEYRDDMAAERADIARDERMPDLRDDNDLRCNCGVRSPHPNCPVCGSRLRPPGSPLELAWMRRHGYVPTAQDIRRLQPAAELDLHG